MIHANDILHIIVADASDIVRQGAAAILASLTGLQTTIHEASSSQQVSEILANNTIHIVIVTPQLGAPNHWKKQWSDTLFVAMISSAIDSQTIGLYDEHFSITDNAEVICAKIVKLLHADNHCAPAAESLSQREKEVVLYAVKGMTNREIASHMGLSIHTIVTHRRNINHKLKVHSAAALIVTALKQGIVTLDDLPD